MFKNIEQEVQEREKEFSQRDVIPLHKRLERRFLNEIRFLNQFFIGLQLKQQNY